MVDSVIRQIVLVLLLAGTMVAQKGAQVCKACSPADMQLQFGPEATSKAKFFTTSWTLAEGTHILAGVTDVLITLKRENPKTCLEGNNGFPEFVHGPELAGELSAEVGFNFFVRWMMTREKPPKWASFISYIGPVAETTAHVYGATRWYYNCR